GEDSDSETVKDPDIMPENATLHMYYHGSDEKYDSGTEQAHYAHSNDGWTWERGDSNPILEREQWHDNHARTAAIIELDDALLSFYEGSGLDDRGNTWNLRTGIGILEDHGKPIIDLSRDHPDLEAPSADSKTGLDSYGTLRYIEIMEDEDSYEIFFEMAREDGSFELRRAEVPR
ncbi:MAG: hypothetical protein SVU32_06595, partial [Candidatus Nanohaloarchaea archaeon]|nr:hypothetical protein [Candidatus Nanohaloarchaea archaeon]